MPIREMLARAKRFRMLICNVLLLAGCASPSPMSGAEPASTPQTTSYDIVAIGASNTEGRGRGATPGGVSRDQAYPAQLERLLESEGCHVRVLNAGKAGDTTYETLLGLPGVLGSGTKVVILDTRSNDVGRGGVGTAANIEAIERAVTQRGASIVMFDTGLIAGAGPYRDFDGHPNVAGHAFFAAYLAPKVRAAGVCSN